jgi:hypothetical protein
MLKLCTTSIQNGLINIFGKQKTEQEWKDNNVETFKKISNLHTAHTFSNTVGDFITGSKTVTKMTSVYLASMVSYTNIYCMIFASSFCRICSFLSSFKKEATMSLIAYSHCCIFYIMSFNFAQCICLFKADVEIHTATESCYSQLENVSSPTNSVSQPLDTFTNTTTNHTYKLSSLAFQQEFSYVNDHIKSKYKVVVTL